MLVLRYKDVYKRQERMLESCRHGFTNATDAADYLVNHGVPFRDAHGIVGKQMCIRDSYKTDRYGNHISADAGAGTCNSRGFRRRRYQADVGKRIAYWWRVNDMCNVYWDYNRRCLCDTDAGTKEAE